MKTYTIKIADDGKATLTKPDGATEALENLSAVADYLMAEGAETPVKQAAEGPVGEMAEGTEEPTELMPPEAEPGAEVRTAKKAPPKQSMKNSLDALLSAR